MPFVVPPFDEAVFVSRGGGQGNGNGDANSDITPVYTPYMTATVAPVPGAPPSFPGGIWPVSPNLYDPVSTLAEPITPFGSFTVAAYSGNPSANYVDSGVDLAWWDYSTRRYMFQHFSSEIAHNLPGRANPQAGWATILYYHPYAWDQPQSLGGVFVNPPVIAEETGGYTYVFGVGTDNCLWASTFVSRGARGAPPTSPSATGICSIF